MSCLGFFPSVFYIHPAASVTRLCRVAELKTVGVKEKKFATPQALVQQDDKDREYSPLGLQICEGVLDACWVEDLVKVLDNFGRQCANWFLNSRLPDF